MGDWRGFPVHQPAANHLAAEMLPDRLMAKAHAKQGRARVRASRHEVKADPGFVRRAGTWRQQEGAGTAGQGLPCRNGVVADDLYLGPELHEVMDEVPGEAVIIVDDEDHGGKAIETVPRWANRNRRGCRLNRLHAFALSFRNENEGRSYETLRLWLDYRPVFPGVDRGTLAVRLVGLCR